MSQQTKIEAAVFRKLLQHLADNTQVQNIDLMIAGDFCRNCISKWYMAEAKQQGLELDYDQAREKVYGMPYEEWKQKYQKPATAEQMAAFDQLQADKKADKANNS